MQKRQNEVKNVEEREQITGNEIEQKVQDTTQAPEELTDEELQKECYDNARAKMAVLSVIILPENLAKECKRIYKLLVKAGDYKDAPVLAEKYLKKYKSYARKARKIKYARAEEIIQNAKSVSDYDRGIRMFRELRTFSDAAEKAETYRNLKLAYIKKQNIRLGIIGSIFLCIAICGGLIVNNWINKRAEANRQKTETADVSEVSVDQWALKDKVVFGKFNWKVLDIDEENNEVLLFGLNSDKFEEFTDRTFNDKEEAVTWKDSAIREWLNGEFLETGFTPEERAMIVLSDVENADNTKYQTEGGEDTQDYVFLFSENEAEEYWDTIKSVSLNWLLRTPGKEADSVMYVTDDHKIRSYGTSVTDDMYIRPVLRVKR